MYWIASRNLAPSSCHLGTIQSYSITRSIPLRKSVCKNSNGDGSVLLVGHFEYLSLAISLSSPPYLKCLCAPSPLVDLAWLEEKWSPHNGIGCCTHFLLFNSNSYCSMTVGNCSCTTHTVKMIINSSTFDSCSSTQLIDKVFFIDKQRKVYIERSIEIVNTRSTQTYHVRCISPRHQWQFFWCNILTNHITNIAN